MVHSRRSGFQLTEGSCLSKAKRGLLYSICRISRERRDREGTFGEIGDLAPGARRGSGATRASRGPWSRDEGLGGKSETALYIYANDGDHARLPEMLSITIRKPPEHLSPGKGPFALDP